MKFNERDIRKLMKSNDAEQLRACIRSCLNEVNKKHRAINALRLRGVPEFDASRVVTVEYLATKDKINARLYGRAEVEKPEFIKAQKELTRRTRAALDAYRPENPSSYWRD